MSKDRDQSGSASVLMQRVIALNGVPDSAKKSPKPVNGPPPLFHKQSLDLGATALEWGAQHLAAKLEPVVVTQPAAEPPSQNAPPAPAAAGAKDSADAEWATYSSISMRPYDDLLLSQRILGLNIEDAVTVQYNPAVADLTVTTISSSTDLASLDRALQSAAGFQESASESPLVAAPASQPTKPEPESVQSQVFVVPAPLMWTVLGLFAACVLVLAFLLVKFVM